MTRHIALQRITNALLDSERPVPIVFAAGTGRENAWQEACRRLEALDTLLRGESAGYAAEFPDELVEGILRELR